jgi:aspartate ammonia-lyase
LGLLKKTKEKIKNKKKDFWGLQLRGMRSLKVTLPFPIGASFKRYLGEI